MPRPPKRIRRRIRPDRPQRHIDLLANPICDAEQAYARNLFTTTVLRLMHRAVLGCLEKSDIAMEWANAHHCAICGEDGLEGDHLRHHLYLWLAANDGPVDVPAPASPVDASLRFLVDLLGLDADSAAILQFVLVLKRSNRLEEIVNCFGELPFSDTLKVIAAAARIPFPRVAACFRPSARLVRSGLLSIDADKNIVTYKFNLKEALLDLAFLPSLDHDTFFRAFFEPSPPPTIGGEDFADRAAIELATALFREALRTGARGVNLLLYGPTGVGKSELARLLGQTLGVQVLSVGRADALGDSATPTERLSSLRLALQVAPRGQSLLFFDELEDLFRWELNLLTPSCAAPQMSKQWFGALLEENEVPIIWCTNRIDGIDDAFLRRFTYAIELKAAGVRQRARILARHLGDAHALSSSDVDAVARRFAASPAQFATAVRAARLVAPHGVPDRPTLERLLAPVHRAITGEDATVRAVFEPGRYRLDALNCREDLDRLAGEIARFVPGPGPGISLCLHGPPGTGKSEFAKYVAWRSGLPLVYRRVSDLLSPYLGETEQKIAAAFEEARQDAALLLFDEADSFLRDRRFAQRTWEVAQVNEFLQQLESFQGVCACTTNLMADLDQAALRRFVFKLEFQFLRPEQARALFAAVFPWAAPDLPDVERALEQVGRLAPGDFAAVSRRVRAVRTEPDASTLVRLLADEIGLKAGAPRPIGF